MASILKWTFILCGTIQLLYQLIMATNLWRIGSLNDAHIFTQFIPAILIFVVCIFFAHAIRPIPFFGGPKTQGLLISIAILMVIAMVLRILADYEMFKRIEENSNFEGMKVTAGISSPGVIVSYLHQLIWTCIALFAANSLSGKKSNHSLQEVFD